MIPKIIRAHGARLARAYGLTCSAHLVGQLYPLMTAFAINGVISGDYRPIVMLGVWHLLMMGLEVAARMYDTRVFTRVYADLAGNFVTRAQAEGMEPGLITARAILSREYVDFLEKDAPAVFSAAIGLVTAMIVMVSLDLAIGLTCLLLIVPLTLVNVALARRALILNRGLNDRLEREVSILGRGRPTTVRRHFEALAWWRIRLSDSEARAFGLMELSVIVLIGAALWRLAVTGDAQAGDVYAVFSYVWRFVIALDQVPTTVQQLTRLKDIDRRMGSAPPPDPGD